MSNFHDDPTIEGATGNIDPDEAATNTPNTPYIPRTDNGLEQERTPLQSSHPTKGPKPLRRWLVAGGLAAALGIGAVGSGALAIVHANGVSTSDNIVATATPAPGKGDHGSGRSGMRAVLTVTSVSGQTIVATRRDGTKVTIHTSSSTAYSRAGQTVSASAVKSGEHIRVRGTRNSDGSITATSINIVLPGYAGMVTAVGGNTVTIQTRSGTTHTVKVNTSTRYYQGRGRSAQPGSLNSIKVGDWLAAQGTLNSDGSLNAEVVYFGQPRPATPSSDTTPSGSPGDLAR